MTYSKRDPHCVHFRYVLKDVVDAWKTQNTKVGDYFFYLNVKFEF